ncbi:MAG: diguanylate cyclase [Candidatus Omnitrophota bacterium]
MNIYAFIPFISGLLNLTMGFYVFFTGRNRLVNKIYFCFSVAVFFYCMNYFGLSYFRPEYFAILWIKIFNIGAFFVVPTLFHLLLISTQEKLRLINKIILSAAYLSAFSALLTWRQGYQETLFTFRWGYSPSLCSLPYLIIFITSITVLLYGLILFTHTLRKTISAYSYKQLHCLLIAYSFGTLGLILNFLPQAQFDVYHLGPPFLAFSLLVVAYAIVQYRFLGIDILINKTILTIVFIIPLLILHTTILAVFLARIGIIASSVISVLILVLIIMFTPYKQLAQKLTDRAIYRGRYDYQKVLQELTQTLVAMLDLEQLLGYIVQIIVQTIDVEHVVLLLEDEEKSVYVIKAYHGIDRGLVDSFVLLESYGIIPWIKRKGNIFVKEEVEKVLVGGEFQDVYQNLHKIKATLVVPLLIKNRLVGVLSLSEKKNKHPYNQGDIDVLNALAVEAAVAIENARLYSEAIVDGLTRLYHHNYFQMRISEEIARSKRYRQPVSLLMIDIDHFKIFNDTYGHPAGDLILKEIAKLLKTKIRETDLPARYGGEEFAIILPDTGSADPADMLTERINKHITGSQIIAERLRESIDNLKIIYEGRNLKVTISIGIACFNGQDRNFSSADLIKKADAALYQAKELGRNRVVLG